MMDFLDYSIKSMGSCNVISKIFAYKKPIPLQLDALYGKETENPACQWP
jgi:hypothetical protein